MEGLPWTALEGTILVRTSSSQLPFQLFVFDEQSTVTEDLLLFNIS